MFFLLIGAVTKASIFFIFKKLEAVVKDSLESWPPDFSDFPKSRLNLPLLASYIFKNSVLNF